MRLTRHTCPLLNLSCFDFMKKAESERWRSFSLWTLRTEEAAHNPKHRRVALELMSEIFHIYSPDRLKRFRETCSLLQLNKTPDRDFPRHLRQINTFNLLILIRKYDSGQIQIKHFAVIHVNRLSELWRQPCFMCELPWCFCSGTEIFCLAGCCVGGRVCNAAHSEA